MEVKVIKDEKNNLVVELNNQTIAEIVRVYLNKDDSVELAAWRKDRPESPVTLEIKTKGKAARKALEEAVSDIEKDTEKILDEFKKSIK